MGLFDFLLGEDEADEQLDTASEDMSELTEDEKRKYERIIRIWNRLLS